jgi:hypothetical protein
MPLLCMDGQAWRKWSEVIEPGPSTRTTLKRHFAPALQVRKERIRMGWCGVVVGRGVEIEQGSRAGASGVS